MKTQEDVKNAMNERAVARSRSKHESRLRYNKLSSTPGGVALIRRAVEPIVKAIEDTIKNPGKPTYGGKDIELLQGLNHHVCAYIALQECIDGAYKRQSLVSIAIAIGRAIEAELDAEALEKKQPVSYARTVMRAKLGKESNSKLRSRIRKGARINEVALRWTPPVVLRLGTRLVDCVIQATGIIDTELVHIYGNTKRRQHKVKFGPGIGEWLGDYNQHPILVKPLYLPMVEKPESWTGLYSGGYRHTPSGGKPVSFVAGMTKHHKKLLEKADFPQVYDAVNIVQETSWQINKKVLDVMRDAWNNQPDHPCLPPRVDKELPPWTDELSEETPGGPKRRVWRTEARKVHEFNAQVRGHRFDFARNMALAEEYKDSDQMFYVHHCDFRGRIYPLANALSPQGPDHARGLLKFSRGKVLGERGYFWLRVHAANLFGYDKVSLQDRVEFIDAHQRDIIGSADGSSLWWTEADKPWQFLGVCFELAEALAIGPTEYISYVPVQVDGSCNGLQHYAALLRDPESAAAVNLVPSDTPADIYQVVADRVTEILKEMVETESKYWEHAAGWLQFGIDRKITKRSVMTVPYAVTFRSSMRYVRTAVREKIEDGTPSPFGSATIAPATVTLGRVVWQAIQEVVHSASKGMAYLQSVAREANKKKLPIIWESPIGFPCYQGYRNFKRRRIRTKFRGGTVVYSLNEETDVLDNRKQVSAIAPNFIHSLDGSHLMLTVLAMDQHKPGEYWFSMIHDSYGTHAADAEVLGTFIRAAFVTMYGQADWLERFTSDVLGATHLEPPAKGSLDLHDVLHADYFFA